jgi:ribonuclease T2
MRRLSAGEITSKMLRANPQLPPQSLAVRCKGDEFEELRVCFSPELKPIACGNGVHTQCRRSSLLLRAARGEQH